MKRYILKFYSFLHLFLIFGLQFSSVQSLSRVRLFATPWIAACQASCPSPTPRVYSNPCPSSRWCHPAISSSVIPFSSCPQSLPASGSFPISQLFALALANKSIGFLGGSVIRNLLAMQETQEMQVRLGWEDPLDKEIATYSSILPWEIPWTKEAGRLQSMGFAELDMI